MNWSNIVANVIVPIGSARVLGFGGIWAAKMIGRAGKE